MRGEPVKVTQGKRAVVTRKMYFREHELIRDAEKCVGCGTCVDVCPEEAISLKPPVIEDGRLKERAVADIDEKKCAFCGVCSDICYFNAITFKIDGEERGSVLEEDFPKLVKRVIWNEALCDPNCNLCEMSCPTGAIEIGEDKERSYETITVELPEECYDLREKCDVLCDEGRYEELMKIVGSHPEVKIKKVERYQRSFNFDEGKCIACGWCQGVCPNGAIVQEGMYEGKIIINTEKCPEDCMVCIDACPCKAICGTPVEVNPAYCMLCGTCKEACPEKAIEIKREKIIYSHAHAGTWFRAMGNLTNEIAYAKEFYSRSTNRMIESIKLQIEAGSKVEGAEPKMEEESKVEGGI